MASPHKLTFSLEGREAMPVRGIPIVTGGSFDAHDLIELFYDPERSVGAETPDPPTTFRIVAGGEIVRVKSQAWALPRERAENIGRGVPDDPQQLSLLPPGVSVWLDELGGSMIRVRARLIVYAAYRRGHSGGTRNLRWTLLS